jgi:hypothetical protein
VVGGGLRELDPVKEAAGRSCAFVAHPATVNAAATRITVARVNLIMWPTVERTQGRGMLTLEIPPDPRRYQPAGVAKIGVICPPPPNVGACDWLIVIGGVLDHLVLDNEV